MLGGHVAVTQYTAWISILFDLARATVFPGLQSTTVHYTQTPDPPMDIPYPGVLLASV